MTTRRSFLASLLAAGAAPSLSWADAGSPAFLAAARDPDGSFALYGVGSDGSDRFRIPLPARGHAGAVHPTMPLAVAFARRPGHFAFVLNGVTGATEARLAPPQGRLFQGHGTFSADGETLFTSECDVMTSQGRVGIWSRRGWTRVGEMATHGIGPHDVARLPGSDTLVVANGGIHTTPDTDREKLNIETMRPSLAYLSPDGALLDQVTLDPGLRQNSIRHLALSDDGLVAFAMQWEGDQALTPPLLGLHRLDRALTLAAAPEASHRAMNNYAGSIALSGDGARLAITSPKGGRVQVFDGAGTFVAEHMRAEVCGVARFGAELVTTDGSGGVFRLTTDGLEKLGLAARAWDNHVVPLPA
jgi:uncharacterized protein